ncbi:MAG: phosphatase PAP2 family protein [Clostridium sp.]|nr:phosphatase PAP2 family protein [Clostridium sp.]
MIDYLIDIDTSVFLTLNGLHADWLDQAMYVFSGRFVWIPLYILIAWLLVRRLGWKMGLVAVAAIGVAVACSDLTCARLIRPVAERLRPANLDNPISVFTHIVNGYRGGAYGFPSCHATNTFALAVCSSLFMRRMLYTILIFIWAVAQCYSRIYLGVHYPGDILAGAAIGAAYGWMLYAIARLYAKKFALG